MRVYAIYMVVAVLVVYAVKDWFKGVCSLILMMAVIEHKDMPSAMMGIDVLTPWNLLLFVTLLSWMANRRREGLQWDMPGHISMLLLMYLAVILVGFLRGALDPSNRYSLRYLITDQVINCIKWVLPGILLFDGCRTRKRIMMAFWSIVGLYLALAALTMHYISWGSRGNFNKRIGWGAVTVAMMLAGGAWAILGALPMVKKKWHKAMVICGFFMATFALMRTQGRMGYITWVALGLIFGIVRYRRYLVLVPVGIVLIVVVFPGVSERMLEGFGETDVAGEAAVDEYAIGSGRLQAWPYVIDKIAESPVIGYGRLAMARTGLTEYLQENRIADGFGHPHNAYLEILLDSGLIGFLIVIAFFSLVVGYAFSLFLDRTDPLFEATGMVTLALVLGFLIAGLGAAHFYPREANTGIWLSIFLTFRVSLERSRVRAGARNDPAACCMPATVPCLSQPSVDWSIP